MQTFPMGNILPTDEYSVNAFRKEVDYLFALDGNRLTAGFMQNAGLKTPFVRYGGWEGMLIGGHTLGHYLTASAQAIRFLQGDEKARMQKKLFAIVDTLELCQQNSRGKEGFIWGAPADLDNVEAQFDHVEKGETNIIKEAWVPWYTMHKLLAGLIDVYNLTGYDKAKKIADKLGDWAFERVSRWDEKTHQVVLGIEYGGMNDALYNLYAITGKAEHAKCAHAFDEENLFDKILSGEKDVLNDKHANTTIPKILGAMNAYLTFGDERYLQVAKTFFQTVVEKHTYVTGGNSEWEHFGRDGVLDAERTNCNSETCNVYNMLKLAKLLFLKTGEKKYLDYFENAYLNAILSSQNPETGMTTYFQPMASGFFKVYSSPFEHFWCCTGSGMENFSKLGDGVYYQKDNAVLVGLYLSSELDLDGGKLMQTANFPWENNATFTLEGRESLNLILRIPDWADEMTVPEGRREGDYYHVTLKKDKPLTVNIPCRVKAYGLPDNENVFALKWGAYVLSADLGNEDMKEGKTGVIVTIPQKRIISTERIYFADRKKVIEDPESVMTRKKDGWTLTGDISLDFKLHYQNNASRYGIYWYFLEGVRTEEAERRTPVDTVQPGYGQYENDELHAMSEKGSVGITSDGTYRYTQKDGYFSYRMRAEAGKAHVLEVTLFESDNGKPLLITVNGEEVYKKYLLYTLGEKYYTVKIDLDEEIVAKGAYRTAFGEKVFTIDVRFSGFNGKESARVRDFICLYLK